MLTHVLYDKSVSRSTCIVYLASVCDLTQRASVSMRKCADWVNLKFVYCQLNSINRDLRIVREYFMTASYAVQRQIGNTLLIILIIKICSTHISKYYSNFIVNGHYLQIVAGIRASAINQIVKQTRIRVQLATTICNRTIRPGHTLQSAVV